MSSALLYERFYDFDRFFYSFFNPRVVGWNHSSNNQQLERRGSPDGAVRPFRPRMDTHENPKNNTVTTSFELPGVKKENAQLDVRNGLLTVSAQIMSSAEHEEKEYAVRERRFGKFSRTLQLPQGVTDEDAKAAMADGVLTITFPKSSLEQAPKKIAIA